MENSKLKEIFFELVNIKDDYFYFYCEKDKNEVFFDSESGYEISIIESILDNLSSFCNKIVKNDKEFLYKTCEKINDNYIKLFNLIENYEYITDELNSGIIIGCDCGCGGDTINIDKLYEKESKYKPLVKKVCIEFLKIKEKIMKKTILITGGTGYIGSHAVVAFQQAGYKTVIVDNLSNSSLETLNGIEKIIGYKPDFYEVDLRTSPQPSPLEEREKEQKINYIGNKKVEGNFTLENIFEKYNFDGVIHFAGLKAVGESCEKPLEYFDNNIVGSIKLFEVMEKFGVKNIVFSSSATVYDMTSPLAPLLRGEGKQNGIREDNYTGNTSNPYGTTKFILEQILKDLAKFSGFRVANLRYFNPIGAHPSGEIGENPAGIPNNLLPFIMKVATGELKKLKVFGNNYPTIDGTGVRDYIDVVDLIDGHLKAYSRITTSSQPSPLEEKEQGQFKTYNLGVGRGVSVLEMVEVARKITKKEIPYKIVERRAGDLAEVYCNPKKAKEELGWEAKTSLEESIKNSWKFYNK